MVARWFADSLHRATVGWFCANDAKRCEVGQYWADGAAMGDGSNEKQWVCRTVRLHGNLGWLELLHQRLRRAGKSTEAYRHIYDKPYSGDYVSARSEWLHGRYFGLGKERNDRGRERHESGPERGRHN